MRYPNAYTGVSKIYLAAVFSVVALVAAFLTGLSGVAAFAGAGLGGFAFFGLVTIVLLIASVVWNISGILHAKKDEQSFGIALLWIIIGFVAGILNNRLSNVPLLGLLTGAAKTVSSFLTCFFVMQGIGNLAYSLSDSDVAARAENVSKLLMIFYGIQVLADLLSGIGILSGLLGVVSLVVGIIASVLYLVVLSRAKEMLRR